MNDVALFVTCLGDMLFPDAVESAVRVLRRAGTRVHYPGGQTCCGQAAYNAGYRDEAARMARQTLRAFRGGRPVVIPSGSCAAMVRHYYADLFAGEPALLAQALDLARRLYEFSEYLVRVLGVDDVGATYAGRVTYHSSCHMLRGLGVREEPLRLLGQVRGIEVVPLERPALCCGFGGTFAVKMPAISGAMLDEKIADVRGTGARTLVSCDAGCLMHLGGGLHRAGLTGVRVAHLAEVLDTR
ncbi:MAG: (Fe-S)-binding protein [Chloroflexota bacterium]